MKTRILTDKEVTALQQSALSEELSLLPLVITSEAQIIDLLDQGLDSFLICRQLGCSALDVVNAERKRKGVKKLLYVEPSSSSKPTEVTDPIRRLSLFPPVTPP